MRHPVGLVHEWAVAQVDPKNSRAVCTHNGVQVKGVSLVVRQRHSPGLTLTVKSDEELVLFRLR